MYVLDLQVSTYLLAGRIPAKAMKHLKSHLVTRFLIGNKKTGNKKVKALRTNTNSFSRHSDKSHYDVRQENTKELS
jgi:hypothetical protein